MQRRAFLKGLAGTAVVSLVSREVVQALTSADAAAPDSPIPAGNPVPQTFQIPNGPGGPSAALQRLTISSDGKTPTVKNFSPEWVAALTQRGAPKVYTAANSADFAYLGMPVGGLGDRAGLFRRRRQALVVGHLQQPGQRLAQRLVQRLRPPVPRERLAGRPPVRLGAGLRPARHGGGNHHHEGAGQERLFGHSIYRSVPHRDRFVP